MNLVIPPSATASYTTSAEDNPDWGLASVWFSIITARGRLFSQNSLAFLVCLLPFNGQISVLGSFGSSTKAVVAVGSEDVPPSLTEGVEINRLNKEYDKLVEAPYTTTPKIIKTKTLCRLVKV